MADALSRVHWITYLLGGGCVIVFIFDADLSLLLLVCEQSPLSVCVCVCVCVWLDLLIGLIIWLLTQDWSEGGQEPFFKHRLTAVFPSIYSLFGDVN